MTLQPTAPSGASEMEAGFLVEGKTSLAGELLLSAQSECAGVGAVDGTVNGSDVVLTLQQMGQVVTLTGVATNDGASMGGTYSVLGSSCAGGSSSGTWSASPVKAVTGSYVGTFNSNAAFSYTFNMNVTQGSNAGTSTSTISGTMNSANAPCAKSLSITGTIGGTAIVLNFLTSDGTAMGQFRGTTSADASTLTGTYDFLPEQNVCTGDGGTITIQLQPQTLL